MQDQEEDYGAEKEFHQEGATAAPPIARQESVTELSDMLHPFIQIQQARQVESAAPLQPASAGGPETA